MNNRQQPITILLLAVFTLGCGEKQPAQHLEATPAELVPRDIEEIATSYQQLRLMTPEPVWVNPELAMLCSPTPQNMLLNARIEKGPHADCAVRIFMDERTATAFERKTSYPVGSVIVKEKELDGKKNGVGGMIKRASGYDAPHGDWEYFYFENPAVIAAGKLESCRQCHKKAAASDYVFGDWATPDDGNPYGN